MLEHSAFTAQSVIGKGNLMIYYLLRWKNMAVTAKPTNQQNKLWIYNLDQCQILDITALKSKLKLKIINYYFYPLESDGHHGQEFNSYGSLWEKLGLLDNLTSNINHLIISNVPLTVSPRHLTNRKSFLWVYWAMSRLSRSMTLTRDKSYIIRCLSDSQPAHTVIEGDIYE